MFMSFFWTPAYQKTTLFYTPESFVLKHDDK